MLDRPSIFTSLVAFTIGIGSEALAYEHHPWKWAGSHPVVPYWVSTSMAGKVPADGTLQDAIDAVNSAADAWNKEGQSNFTLVYAGTTDVAHCAADGKHVVHYHDGSSPWGWNHAAYTCVWYQNGLVNDFDIAFYREYPDGTKIHWGAGEFVWPWETDVQGMMVHEFGHAIGLAHSQHVNAVMGSACGKGCLTNRDLSEDDILGMQSIYGVTTTPTTSLQTCALDKFVPPDGQSGDVFGSASAMDGHRAAIAAGQADVGGVSSGKVYVYARDAHAWKLEQILVPPAPAEGLHFGSALAMSGDRLAVSAVFAGPGATHVYRRDPSGWVHEQSFSPGGAIAMDEDRLVIGDVDDASFGSDSGIARVFRRQGTTWSLEAIINPSDATTNLGFGVTVALSEDRLLASSFKSRVYAFRLDPTGWSEEATLVSPTGEPGFGKALALDGDTALVGNPSEYVPQVTPGTGAVFVYQRQGTSWIETQKLVPLDLFVGDSFGGSIALDGDTALIGANGDNAGFVVDVGAAYFYRRVGSTWSEAGKIHAGDATTNDHFGRSVALSGPFGIVSSVYDDDNGAASGSAFVYPRDPFAECGAGVGWDLCAISADGSLDVDGNGVLDDCEALTEGAATVSIVTGGTISFHFDAGTSYAGAPYLLLGSAGGTAPGLLLGSAFLPLKVPDPYFDLTLSYAGSSLLPGSAGYLDGAGAGAASLVVPPGLPPILAGLTLHHALVLFGSTQLPAFASHAVPLTLTR